MSQPHPTSQIAQAARAALERNDRGGARAILAAAIRGGGVSGEIWWLLAQTLDDPAQQADCYRRASAAGYAPPPAPPAPPSLAPPTAGAPPASAAGYAPSVAPAHPSPAPADMPPASGAAALQVADPIEESPPFRWEMAPAAPAPPASAYSNPLTPAAAQPPAGRQRKPAAEKPIARQTGVAAAPADPKREADIAYVLEQFGKHEHRYEIVRGLALRRDCTFAQAEEIVRYVEQHHGRSIAKRQLPLILALGVFGIISGLFMALSAFVYIPFVGLILRRIGLRPMYRLFLGLGMIGSGAATLWGGLRALNR